MNRSSKPSKPPVAAVILAGGASTRFGKCKQLLDWEGKPLVAHVSDIAMEAGLGPVIVVLGCRAEDTYQALGDRPVRKLINWLWREGMSTSVRTGLAAVPPEAEGAVFLQCDQPGITPDLLRALVDRFDEKPGSIVHPVQEGQRGTPVVLPRDLFAELAAVTGDTGGRELIRRHPDRVISVSVDDPALLLDVDTPEDYERLRRLHSSADQDDPSAVLRPIKHVIIDMDGVLWRRDEPLPGLPPFFGFLREHDITFTLATNNASQTPEQFTEKLARFGVTVGSDSVLTSALVVAGYLSRKAPTGSPIYIIGEEGLRRALIERGFVVHTDEQEDVEADYVVVGWDRALTWEKLSRAAYHIYQGATFIGTNPDITFPVEWGEAPGNGAILHALEVSTGVEPIVTGKPEPQMYEEALRRMDATPKSTAMIGDRIETDIVGAARVGLTTVLTLSGISTTDDVSRSATKPDLVCDDIVDLVSRWRRALAEE